MTAIKSPKKLIEVALPLDAINDAASSEKTVRHGHPSSIHLWWARRPLATARAVIFSQMVNDPGYQQGSGFKFGMNKEKAAIERERLFGIIEELVKWENTGNSKLLEVARAEIKKSWIETCELNRNHPEASRLFNPDEIPAFHDPFAGGGALPLEAQRLGLSSYASDLNPVAVTINKSMIEIPPRFSGRNPVGPKNKNDKQSKLSESWKGAQGLAEDVYRYGSWIREEAEHALGHLYPHVEISADDAQNRPQLKQLIGKKLPVISWIWARTVKSPNPAFSHVDIPLVSNFVLSSKAGKQVFVEPIVKNDEYTFVIHDGIPKDTKNPGTTAGKRAGFICVMSGSPIDYKYIRSEGAAGRIGFRLMAVVADGPKGRVYLSPNKNHEITANIAVPEWRPDVKLTGKCRVNVSNYGMDTYGDLFTNRQLHTLSTFSDLITKAMQKCEADAINAGFVNDGVGLEDSGSGAKAYSQAVAVYLSFALDKMADLGNSLVRWEPVAQCPRQLFGRQAIPMIWDFAEANPLGDSSGGWSVFVNGIYKAFLKGFETIEPWYKGTVCQGDAQTQSFSQDKVVSTDPPYYDNIEYADLSDFFYVWMRKTLKSIYPNLFATLAVPKADELVATPQRHGGKENAEKFFLDGMTLAMRNLAEKSHPAFPVTIYYAFKQAETKGDAGTHSTGWETFLEAVINAGFSIVGTWPMRTENVSRMIGQGANALASSIVLVCRQRLGDAATISRREFLRELNATLPEALLDMTRGGVNSPVAPVDLSQAIIGPGMAIFSKYKAVLEADGNPMSVRTALQLINRFFAEDDFDHDTQFCLHWFETQGWATGKFGDADVLARAKGTSVGGLNDSGVVESGAGNLRLLRWAELSKVWSPEGDDRTPVWESLHQLIRSLNQDGEAAAGSLLARMPARAESIRALAYRLYTLCERKGWAEEARAYNELVAAWSSIEQAATDAGILGSQAKLDI